MSTLFSIHSRGAINIKHRDVDDHEAVDRRRYTCISIDIDDQDTINIFAPYGYRLELTHADLDRSGPKASYDHA